MRQLSVASVFTANIRQCEITSLSEKMFEEDVEAKYKCAICLFILEDPVQTPCGHLFCRPCIITSIRYEAD